MSVVETTAFGPFLRDLRKVAGFSQRELARRAGVDFTYLSKIENERLPPPSEEKVRLLARLLHHSADDLVARARKVPRDIQSRMDELPSEAAVLLHRIVSGNMTRDQFKRMLKVAGGGEPGAQARPVPQRGGSRKP